MVFRKAVEADISAVAQIFERVVDAQDRGELTVGWERGVYPTETTARAALERQDLFVGQAENGSLAATAVINQLQVDVYRDAPWQHPAEDAQVMVLHTLAVDPQWGGTGWGKAFVDFYEAYALEHGCSCLRMDTNERNLRARSLYRRLGYAEIDTVPCRFNGIEGVRLVLLEKYLKG